MYEIRLSDLSVLNIEQIEQNFSETLDFNSVVDTFDKMKKRWNSECGGPMYNVCTFKYWNMPNT